VSKPGHTEHAASGSRPPPTGLRPATRHRHVRAVLLAVALLLLLPATGFIWFIWRVPASEITLAGNADGIVALTGGTSRIADAIELLASGRGKRLLITGVHRSISQDEIARLVPGYERTVRCCVELDHSAMNTLGNAIATREWATRRRFQSLIVVTSNYHMPRAMAELSHQLPDMKLIPFPVVSEHGATTRLLLSEYVKYIVAVFRIRLNGGSAANHESRISLLRRPIDPTQRRD